MENKLCNKTLNELNDVIYGYNCVSDSDKYKFFLGKIHVTDRYEKRSVDAINFSEVRPFNDNNINAKVKYTVFPLPLSLPTIGRLSITDNPTYGDPKTTIVSKEFYVVPELQLQSEIIRNNPGDEIMCGDTITLKVRTDYITDNVKVTVLGNTHNLIKKSSTSIEDIWELDYTIPELDETQDVNFKFTAETKYGSQDIYANPNTVTRIKTSNTIVNITALKLENFKVTDMVNHEVYSYAFPISKDKLPIKYIAGYYTTLEIEAKGNPNEVSAIVSYSNTPDTEVLKFTKVDQVGTKGIWQAKYYSDPNLLKNVSIYFTLEATKNTSSYNYNAKESWDGHTFIVDGTSTTDILIKRDN